MSLDETQPPSPVRYSQASSILGLAIALPIINLIVVALRFFARKKQKLHIGSDDWLCIGALIFTWACAICIYAGIGNRALGYSVPELSFAETDAVLRTTRRIEWVHTLMFIIAISLVKLSFLLLLRRTLRSNTQKTRRLIEAAIWTAVVLDLLWLVSLFIAHLAQCNSHLSAIWGSSAEELEHCSKEHAILLGNSVSDVVISGLAILLALPVAWNLQLTAGKRIGLTIAFIFGLLALAVSLTRLVTIVQFNTISTGIDQELHITNLVWWTFFEVGISMLASCLPTLGPLFNEIATDGWMPNLKIGLESLIYIAPPTIHDTPVMPMRQDSFKPDLSEQQSRSTVASKRSKSVITDERSNSVMSELKALRRGDDFEYVMEHRALDMFLVV